MVINDTMTNGVDSDVTVEWRESDQLLFIVVKAKRDQCG
jgi:hypothetical protein